MKKLFLTLILLLPIAVACHKNNDAENEMKLPTPVVSPTPIVVGTPSALTTALPTPTDTPTLDYTIEDIKGTGLILTGDDTVPESAVEGESVEPGDELITKDDSEMTLALNDNTMVHLAADSQIKVTELTPNATNGFSSKIELLLGNVLSEVEKLTESQSSFEIASGGVVCGVRGTAFEVQKQGDNVSTSTFHGIVDMQKDGIIQRVPENKHSSFSLKNSSFMAQRGLKIAERKHYQTWTKTRTKVQHKRASRIAGGNPSIRPSRHTAKDRPGNGAKSKKLSEGRAQHQGGKKLKGKNKHAGSSNGKEQSSRPHQTGSPQEHQIHHEQSQTHPNNQSQGQSHANNHQPAQPHQNNHPQGQQHPMNHQPNQPHPVQHQQNQQHSAPHQQNQQHHSNNGQNKRKKKNY